MENRLYHWIKTFSVFHSVGKILCWINISKELPFSFFLLFSHSKWEYLFWFDQNRKLFQGKWKILYFHITIFIFSSVFFFLCKLKFYFEKKPLWVRWIKDSWVFSRGVRWVWVICGGPVSGRKDEVEREIEVTYIYLSVLVRSKIQQVKRKTLKLNFLSFSESQNNRNIAWKIQKKNTIKMLMKPVCWKRNSLQTHCHQ